MTGILLINLGTHHQETVRFKLITLLSGVSCLESCEPFHPL